MTETKTPPAPNADRLKAAREHVHNALREIDQVDRRYVGADTYLEVRDGGRLLVGLADRLTRLETRLRVGPSTSNPPSAT